MLTDAECRKAACPAGQKRERFYDTGGMYLQVDPNGSKRWFLKYRILGKEKQLALGSYPSVTLAAARQARDAAKLQKADGRDPVLVRQIEKLKTLNPDGETFEQVALEWFKKQEASWSDAHAHRSKRQFERDLFPLIGKRKISEIEPVELLATLRRVEQRGAVETADRCLMLARQVWRYGVATGRVSRDIAADLKGALTPYRGKHFAAITEPKKLGVLMLAIRAYGGGIIVRAALHLAPLLFQRPGELRAAEWSEIDLEDALWTIPAARMKRTKEGKENGDVHYVPLARQAVEVLRALHGYTGVGRLVFPGERSHERPLSDNSVRSALLTLGFGSDVQTWHGFRATARTMLAERLEFDPQIIEAQLAHSVKDANGRAYNRTSYLAQRRVMMQRWADYLDELATAARTPFIAATLLDSGTGLAA